MSGFHRGIAWGLLFALPMWAWIILVAYVIGRAS